MPSRPSGQVKPNMEENATPSYAELRQERADAPKGTGLKFLRAKDFPNGLDVTVVRTEVRPEYVPLGTPATGKFDAYWVVKTTDKDKDGNIPEGEVYVKESGFVTGKLEELNIDDPAGKRFILSQTEYRNQKTFQIARAL